jgi:hypothetical protein
MTKMKIPIRVIELILKKLQNKTTSNQKEVIKKVEEIKVEEKEVPKTIKVDEETEFKQLLVQLKRETIDSQVFLGALEILDKVTLNIIKDSKNETFRTLRTTNEKLKEKLFNFPASIELLLKVIF